MESCCKEWVSTKIEFGTDAPEPGRYKGFHSYSLNPTLPTNMSVWLLCRRTIWCQIPLRKCPGRDTHKKRNPVGEQLSGTLSPQGWFPPQTKHRKSTQYYMSEINPETSCPETISKLLDKNTWNPSNIILKPPLPKTILSSGHLLQA